MSENEKRLNVLFEELVPAVGKASSVAGELVRAAMRIAYRSYNDGDHIGVGYGNETCNSAARYLLKYGSRKVRKCVRSMWGVKDSDAYSKYVDALCGEVSAFVEKALYLRDEETEDMFSLSEKSDYEHDEDEEDY